MYSVRYTIPEYNPWKWPEGWNSGSGHLHRYRPWDPDGLLYTSSPQSPPFPTSVRRVRVEPSPSLTLEIYIREIHT